ncbi:MULTISPECIES: DUF7537 family lipoprotein [Salinibaculum]|uniref:DUF7537 family lipoprotein n=1 Tax=Salinibaculum TaxID=2732368 RepID=UPI0030D20933
MKGLRRLGSRIERRHVLTVFLVALVALSGCAGLGGGDDATATPTATATETPADGADGGDGGTGTATAESVDVSAAEVVGPAVDAMNSVESYRFTGSLTQTVQAPNSQQNVSLELNTSVDRANQRLMSEQTIDAGVQTLTTNTYIVDGTLYQRGQQFVQQYNSEWIQVDVSSGIEEQFNRNDELGAHRVMLENSSVDLVGAQTVDGERAYRLELDVDEEALSDFYGFNGTSVTLQSVNTTIWVGTESNQVLRAAGDIRQQITAQGQQLTTVSTYDERFHYTDVDITLPDAASGAVEVNQTTGLAA